MTQEGARFTRLLFFSVCGKVVEWRRKIFVVLCGISPGLLCRVRPLWLSVDAGGSGQCGRGC